MYNYNPLYDLFVLEGACMSPSYYLSLQSPKGKSIQTYRDQFNSTLTESDKELIDDFDQLKKPLKPIVVILDDPQLYPNKKATQWQTLEEEEKAQLIAYKEARKTKNRRMKDINQKLSKMSRIDRIKYLDQQEQIQKSLDPRHLTKLSGPTSFYYFNVLHKSLLFMGEAHSIDFLCDLYPSDYFEVHTWLGQLIQLSDHCIDLFVEDFFYPEFNQSTDFQPAKTDPLSMFGAPVGAIRRKFENCNNTSCYDGKLRYHLADVRHTMDGSTMAFEYSLWHQELSEWTPDHFDLTKYLQMLHYCVGLDDSQTAKDAYFAFLKTVAKRTQYDFQKTDQDYLIIHQYVVNKIKKEIAKLSSQIDKKSFLGTLCQVTTSVYNQSYFGLQTIQQDAYLLARLFMIFDQKKMSRGPKYCRDAKSQEVHHAIIYSGDAHTAVYVAFFKQFFKIEPEIAIKNDLTDACLVLPQPFDFFKDQPIN